MSNVEAGSISFASTGAQSISLNGSFTPTWVIFFTGGLFNTNETTNARGGAGFSDANYEWAHAALVNSSTKSSRAYPGAQAFAILDGASGNPIVLGSVTSFGLSTINVSLTNASSSYQIGLICGN